MERDGRRNALGNWQATSAGQETRHHTRCSTQCNVDDSDDNDGNNLGENDDGDNDYFKLKHI